MRIAHCAFAWLRLELPSLGNMVLSTRRTAARAKASPRSLLHFFFVSSACMCLSTLRLEGGGLVGGNRRVRRLVARGVLRRAPLRKGLLVVPRDSWPPVGGGLSLEPAGHARDGAPRFRYAHSAAYLARPRAGLGCMFPGQGWAVEWPCGHVLSAERLPDSKLWVLSLISSHDRHASLHGCGAMTHLGSVWQLEHCRPAHAHADRARAAPAAQECAALRHAAALCAGGAGAVHGVPGDARPQCRCAAAGAPPVPHRRAARAVRPAQVRAGGGQ